MEVHGDLQSLNFKISPTTASNVREMFRISHLFL
jgi:hypothetical protein